MTFAESNIPTDPTAANNTAETQSPATSSQPTAEATSQGNAAESAAEAAKRRILIGSQRDAAASLARPRRDWKPIEELPKKQKKGNGERGGPKDESPKGGARMPVAKSEALPQNAKATPESPVLSQASEGETASKAERADALASPPAASTTPPAAPAYAPRPAPLATSPVAKRPAPPAGPVPVPSVREKLSPELEDELNQAFGSASLEDLMQGGSGAEESVLEVESVHAGRVVAVRRDDVFVELGSREQGIVSLRQFDVPPAPGTVVQVMIQRFNPEDGLYELSMPNKAVQVDDWSDLVEGKLVEVRVTGHNTGGLECEVNHIRGFIPVSQIALFRVEDLAQFVDQRLTCVITEADPDRRNLVLSRRAVLEREREQAREQLLNSLKPGQILDGVVRKLMDFGAFVDLGGADGLLHISQLAWGRVKHPSDVLQEGQKVRVRIEKVDPETGRISLAYRDLFESPWAEAAQKYPPNSTAHGTVTKLMDFGAFVELEPGIEGLVHISELSHKRIWRASDVVHEGDQVDVLVLSVDAESQRMSLSVKALSAAPETAKKTEDEPAEAAPLPKKQTSKKRDAPLMGGIGRPSGGERFGLKW